MVEYTIGTGWDRDASSAIVTDDRLSLIGCIGVWSNALKRFPLPMLGVDGQKKVTEFDGVIRVEGLLPSEVNPNHLLLGNWDAQVDIPGLLPFGEGSVYLGNANTPSDTWGYIFEEPQEFIPDFELGFVHSPEGQTVLWERDYDGEVGYLVYTDTSVLEGLGKIHRYHTT